MTNPSLIYNVYKKRWIKTKNIISVEVVGDAPLKSVQEIIDEYTKKISNPDWGKMSEEAKKKLSEQRIGTNNKASKWWRITFNDGRTIEKCGLVNWCKENGYDLRSIQRVKNKQRKKHKDIVAVEELAQAPARGATDAL